MVHANDFMICSNCQTELPSGARFCMNCGQPVQASTPLDQLRSERLAAAAPVSLVEKARAARKVAGERRIVTALYLDVVDSTGLSHQLGAEIWAQVLNQAFDRCSAVIYQYEGTIAHVQEDELLAFFGAPVAHEDDPVRAVRVALEVRQVISQFDQEISQAYGCQFTLRLSLSTGPVTIGPVGDQLIYEYSALGGTLNQVVQLEAAKLPMTVLVTADTYRFIQPFFDCVDLGEVEVKDFQRSIHIYRVEGPKALPEAARGVVGLHSPMVGREAELAMLLQLNMYAAAGLGRAVVILGEPGLGKTRLIAEWKTASRLAPGESGFRWVEGNSLSYGQRLAYHLILSLLHSLIGIPGTSDEPETRAALCALFEAFSKDARTAKLVPDLLDVYPHLANFLSLNLDEEERKQIHRLDPQAYQAQILSGTRNLLLALAAIQPLVVVLEDLHWADPSSVDFMMQLLPLVSTERILFCLVMRPERDAPGWRLVTAARTVLGNRLTEINLSALTEKETRRLVSNLLEIEALPDPTRNVILKKAEGNPFFVEEVIRMLIDQDAIVKKEGKWFTEKKINRDDIPDNLQGLLQARIDRLPEEVKHTLKVAAVIGRQFQLKVLEQVLRLEEKHGSH
jgi:class 3 adenylate cyclase